MLEGEMTLTVDAETWSLKTGDSFRFASRRPHRFSNPADDAEGGGAVGELRDGRRHERRSGTRRNGSSAAKIGVRTARIGARSPRDGTARPSTSLLTKVTPPSILRPGVMPATVIARSEATKQSMSPRAAAWIASLRSQ